MMKSTPRRTAMIRKVDVPEGIEPVELERELNNALKEFESMLQDDGIRREIEFIAKISRHLSAQDLETKIGKAGP
jgi:hypothetical protein